MRNIEDHVVENVKCLGAEFKVSLFSQPYVELPEKGQVEIAAPVRIQRIWLFIAIRVGRRQREGARIEPLRRGVGTGAAVWIAGHVHSFLDPRRTYVLRIGAGRSEEHTS